MPVTACAKGCGYCVTADCHASAPLKADRLFQRCTTVHTPRGAIASADASRARTNAPRGSAEVADEVEGEVVTDEDMGRMAGFSGSWTDVGVQPSLYKSRALRHWPSGMGRGSAYRAACRAAAAIGLCIASTWAIWPVEARAATLAPHDAVDLGRAAEVTAVELRPVHGAWRSVAWDDLDGLALTPGDYELRAAVEATGDGQALEIPPCAGRKRVVLDGRGLPGAPGPVVAAATPGPHRVVVEMTIGRYEGRVACGYRPRVGPPLQTGDGLGVLEFESPYGARGGGRAVVYLPPGHDRARPGPVLVGAHPWNGSMWTYAAYAGLLREAKARDVVLLLPSGLGNSLYTADAEDEMRRAIDALSANVAVDRARVSIWGASMGGAGATTIGFHNPDRFATVTSFFGDSKYDLGTYVRSILGDERGAHRVNALDVVDNARSLPVWLVHGEDDRTSPIRQSELLADALRQRGFAVRFDRVPGVGHSGALVARFLPEVVALAATARVPDVARVTYRSVSETQQGAYGVRLVRAGSSADAFVDVERRPDGLHVRAAEGVRAIELAPGALGFPAEGPRPAVVFDDVASAVRVVWGPPP